MSEGGSDCKVIALGTELAAENDSTVSAVPTVSNDVSPGVIVLYLCPLLPIHTVTLWKVTVSNFRFVFKLNLCIHKRQYKVTGMIPDLSTFTV